MAVLDHINSKVAGRIVEFVRELCMITGAADTARLLAREKNRKTPKKTTMS